MPTKTYLALTLLTLLSPSAFAEPPALTTASFMKHTLSYAQCQQKSKEIMEKMNLEIQDHGNGTIGGFGEQSAAIVNCHQMGNATYIQIAVSSQNHEASELIMKYLNDYLQAGSLTTP